MDAIKEGVAISGPIYIGGVSYSGKTQLRLLLSQHPNMIITRRTYLWSKFYQKFGSLEKKENFEACLEAILKLNSIQSLNPDPSRIRDEFWQGERSYQRLFSIIHQHYAESLGKDRWGIQIKLVEKEADLILNADPSAKIIQIMRNPLDRIEESILTSSRRKLSLGFETSLWQESSRYAQKNLENYPERYLVVKWEDLLADVDQTLEQICSFLGEDYSAEMIQSEAFAEIGLDLAGQSANGHRRLEVKNPPSGKLLTKTEKTYILTKLQSQMANFGYTDEKLRMNFSEKINYLSLHFPVYFLGAALKFPRELLHRIK